MKLSTKQKEVIKLMRENRLLAYHRYIGYSAISFSNPTYFVNKHTVRALIMRNLIKAGEQISYSSHIYKLTELGKTINID